MQGRTAPGRHHRRPFPPRQRRGPSMWESKDSSWKCAVALIPCLVRLQLKSSRTAALHESLKSMTLTSLVLGRMSYLLSSHATSITSVLIWVSLPRTGGTSWSHVNLTLPGNRENVTEARKKFVKLWASFVDMSTGLDKIGVQYAIEWPKHCVYWDWSRVKKWIEAHPIQKAHFDGCRFGLINNKGEYVKKPWTVATTIPQLYDKFSGKCCKGGHTHGKCTKESESYTSPFARTVHSTFSASVAEAVQSKARRATVAAVATQVPKALSIPSHPPVADMAAQHKQVLTVDEREYRAQAFFENLTNPDRLADAMAGLTPQAWVNDVFANMEDPPADAADTDLYLGNIPVREWRHVRDNAPGLDWLGCYELWHRFYARRHRGDMESDFTNSSTAKIIYELIQDMAALGSLTKQGHALDITKEYDLMYRVFMLKDGCGYIPIYPNTVKILQNFFTPALVRLPPPTDVRSHVLIAGDSSLALCWFNRKTNAQGDVRGASSDVTSQRIQVCGASCPDELGSRHQHRPVHEAGTRWPFPAWTSSRSGLAMTFTGPTGTWATHGTSSTRGSPKRGWTARKRRTGRPHRTGISTVFPRSMIGTWLATQKRWPTAV